MRSLNLSNSGVIKALMTFFVLSIAQISLAAEDVTSESAMQEGVIAYDSKMYGFSKKSFEKALELNRSNYEAMLYLAKVHYFLDEYSKANKHASGLASSFYPPKKLKIEAFQLLRDIENKRGNPWLALSYIQAASNLSTNIDISHLVEEQIKSLDFNALSFPDFSEDSDGVITSPTLSFDGTNFSDVTGGKRFSPVPFRVKQIGTKFVALAGFDDRKRFTKLLLLRSKNGLKPKLQEVPIRKRSRGGVTSANDLFLKVMDWNFDGYPDFAVRSGSKKEQQAFLLFNPRNERYKINEDLSELEDPILDTKTQAILEEDCQRGKNSYCSRKRYKLFAGEYALAQFEKNRCDSTEKRCMYTSAEIEVSSLRSREHMYLVNTIETQFEELKSRFSSSGAGTHTIITRRVLNAYYTPNYDVDGRKEEAIMTLDLDGSWEFPASYVKGWVNNYFSRQPLDNGLVDPIPKEKAAVIN